MNWSPRSRSALALSIALAVPAHFAGAQDSTGAPRCAVAKDEVSRLWCQGGALFIQHDQDGYAKAIAPYSRALALEKKQRVLGRPAWLVLIDNLGMAYGITGDLPKAKETFEYGLSKEPTYPMFHYNMACVFAESGDEAKTIEHLREAFTLRANMIPGETMPDPSTDDSFQRFMHSARFLAALKTLPGKTP